MTLLSASVWANYRKQLQTTASHRKRLRSRPKQEYRVSVPLRSGEKIDAAYMAVLSRKLTTREKALCLQAQDKGLSTVEDLIYALINTRQFIFNQ